MIAPVAASMVLEATERGLDACTLLSRLGLDAQTLASPERRVPFAALFSVWADCMRALRDPGLPLAAAQRIRLEDYTALGFALTAASSVRAAVSTLVRYGRFIGDGDSWRVDERVDGNLRLRWERAGERTLGHRVANECAIAEALHAARQMVGERVVPAAIAFRHAAPQPLDAHLEFFGIRPRFGADWEGLELPRTLLDRVPRLANPPLAAYLERQLVSSLANRPPPAESISERVAQLLEQDLASGEPGVAAIASALATSERTSRAAEGAVDLPRSLAVRAPAPRGGAARVRASDDRRGRLPDGLLRDVGVRAGLQALEWRDARRLPRAEGRRRPNRSRN